jgi:hypothetical protein
MISTGATCMLRLVRGSGYADWLRRYKIFINGTQVGTIARDAVLDLEVPSGPFTIEARLDWGRSQPLTIVATPEKRIEIEVSNSWGALRALWGATFGFRTYLTLKRLPAA